MRSFKKIAGPAAAMLALMTGAGIAAPATAATPKAKVAALPTGTQRPTTEVLLSVGQGQLVTLPASVAPS